MPATLIIGYGNSLRGDDAFGWLAARRLQHLVRDAGIEILAVHQLTPELMEPLSMVRRVIFLDAATGEEPGKLTTRIVEAADVRTAAFTHFATPEALLAGALALYGQRPEALLVTVAGRDFSLGAQPSEPVKRALESLDAAWVEQLVASITDRPS